MQDTSYNCASKIYIPLWFYLYRVPAVAVGRIYLFTFHYGSTYMEDVRKKGRTNGRFTFHYGSTYMRHPDPAEALMCYLHSTMVLLI